jgi:hypothetical protein
LGVGLAEVGAAVGVDDGAEVLGAATDFDAARAEGFQVHAEREEAGGAVGDAAARTVVESGHMGRRPAEMATPDGVHPNSNF